MYNIILLYYILIIIIIYLLLFYYLRRRALRRIYSVFLQQPHTTIHTQRPRQNYLKVKDSQLPASAYYSHLRFEFFV